MENETEENRVNRMIEQHSIMSYENKRLCERLEQILLNNNPKAGYLVNRNCRTHTPNIAHTPFQIGDRGNFFGVVYDLPVEASSYKSIYGDLVTAIFDLCVEEGLEVFADTECGKPLVVRYKDEDKGLNYGRVIMSTDMDSLTKFFQLDNESCRVSQVGDKMYYTDINGRKELKPYKGKNAKEQ